MPKCQKLCVNDTCPNINVTHIKVINCQCNVTHMFTANLTRLFKYKCDIYQMSINVIQINCQSDTYQHMTQLNVTNVKVIKINCECDTYVQYQSDTYLIWFRSNVSM